MKKKSAYFFVSIFFATSVVAQVQVREEPRHKLAFQNKYIRLLDVWISPGDTSLFHVHSTPSLFLHFTTSKIAVQIKGGEWQKEQNEKGKASYRSFINDTLIHRVSNLDIIPFHVTDIEILASYNEKKQLPPLPFPVLWENEKAFAYHLIDSSINTQTISGRGPLVAELVEGAQVVYHETGSKTTEIKTGHFLYIQPGTSFHLSAKKDEKIKLILFEIK